MRSHLMEGSFMRKRRLPVAVIALGAVVFVALAGTAAAGGSGLITGVQIKNGSIGLADLSKKAKTSLKGQRGQPALKARRVRRARRVTPAPPARRALRVPLAVTA